MKKITFQKKASNVYKLTVHLRGQITFWAGNRDLTIFPDSPTLGASETGKMKIRTVWTLAKNGVQSFWLLSKMHETRQLQTSTVSSKLDQMIWNLVCRFYIDRKSFWKKKFWKFFNKQLTYSPISERSQFLTLDPLKENGRISQNIA